MSIRQILSKFKDYFNKLIAYNHGKKIYTDLYSDAYLDKDEGDLTDLWPHIWPFSMILAIFGKRTRKVK